ncbi:MAG: phosphoribosylformimino-5-aminoimidazole carboxamide ribotide isomerase, partial [Desulfocapsaceae bacterium]
KCSGVEEQLISMLGRFATIPTTYAGGVRNLGDLELINHLGGGRLDATIGSALDIFGGSSISYAEAVRYHKTINEPDE